jgi:hypothetical protein
MENSKYQTIVNYITRGEYPAGMGFFFGGGLGKISEGGISCDTGTHLVLGRILLELLHSIPYFDVYLSLSVP